MTIVVNFISGPSSGKSLMSALLYAEMKARNLKVEYVQEYAKNLVWLGNFEELNNQYNVSLQQYRILQAMNDKVDYIVCDTSLLVGLYYNSKNKDNVCNIEKTKAMILKRLKEFKNKYIFIDRNPLWTYEQHGRIQNEQESKLIDIELKVMLNELGIDYHTFLSHKDKIKGKNFQF